MSTDINAIKKRNRRALKFFSDRQLDVRAVGTLDNPAFLLNNELVLNCYVKNFWLLFMDAINGIALIHCEHGGGALGKAMECY